MKALFIVLANSQKIIESAKTIAAFKAQNPFANINILIDEQHIDVAKNIRAIDNIHTIKVDRIKDLNDKKVFSDAHMLNQLVCDLEGVTNTTWDLVHNYSNNNSSAYLMGFLVSTKKTGAYFNTKHLLNHSNTWAAVLNTQVSRIDSTLTQGTVHKHILGLDENDVNVPFNLDETNLSKARTTFNNLRGNLAPDTKVLGLSAYHNEDFNEKIELLEKLIDKGGHYPVLFTSLDEKDVQFAASINAHFDEALLQVEVDLKTLPCVILNMDIIITNDENTFALANALDTPTITCLKKAIKTISTSNVYFIRKASLASRVEDILDHFNSSTLHTLPDVIYSYEDVYGISLKTGDIGNDIRAHLMRMATFVSLGFPLSNNGREEFIKNFSLAKLRSILPEIKEELSKSLKITLASIRILKQYQNADRYEKAFWAKVSQVFALENENIITRDFVSLFCAHIYNIDTGIKEENLSQIETQLYSLKNNIQLINDAINFINEDHSVANSIPNISIRTNL